MAKNGGLIVFFAILLIGWGIIDVSINSSQTTAQCSDGIDNDGDGNNDSSDTHCIWATNAEPPQVPIFYYCPDHNDETTTPTFSSSQEAISAGCEQV